MGAPFLYVVSTMKKKSEPKILDNEADIRSALLNYLARREYSRQELLDRLANRCEQALLHTVLDRFEEAGYQSDERFAGVLLRSKSQQGYGLRRVQMDAKRKGLEDSLILQAEEAEEVDWFELAKSVYLRKYREPVAKGDYKTIQKRQRFMLNRGFSFDQIRYAMDSEQNDE
jgi:regulatory protein